MKRADGVLESKFLPRWIAETDCGNNLFGVVLEQAGAGLEKIVAASLRRVPQEEAPLLAWPLVCGSVVAQRTRAVGFSDRVLRVEVSDAAWKNEMQGLAPRYVAALNRYTGRKVERIEFVIRQS